jgi:hypothetical protein
MLRNLLIITLLVISLSCSTKERHFGKFDFKAFKSDRGSCNEARTKMIDELKNVKEEIKGMSQNEVFDTFGRYDMQLLDERNTKSFIYFLEKGPHCETPKKPSQARTMVLRFNAVSLVNEVEFMQGIPL